MTASPVRLRVPATSANLGPGFDSLGLAVGLHLDVHARASEHDCLIYRGEGDIASNHDNLLHEGFKAACRAAGREPFPVTFEVDNPIPLARGLGSSSAALVGGAAAADALLGGPLGRDGVFEVTVGVEGHPDNVGPAVYGNFTVSALDSRGRYLTRSLPIPPEWHLLFAVPDHPVFTEEARRLLPESYSRDKVVLTASRTALWTLAVASDAPELLRTASIDLLHQPYRSPLLTGFEECLEDGFAAGAYAVYLSGSGPTVGSVVAREAIASVRPVLQRYAGAGGRVLELRAAGGYQIVGQATLSVHE